MAGIDAILGDPVWAALLGLVAFLAFMVAWNLGNRWIVNILAQKEPAVAAIGVFVGAAMFPEPIGLVAGIALIMFAAGSIYTGFYDI